MIITYERVSTIKQNTARQEGVLKQQLEARGITKVNRKYVDKVSGKFKENRPELQKMLSEAKEGDILYCESISRLGRNLKDLIEIIEQLVNKGVQVVIFKEGIDTSNSTYKLLLAIFGGVAEMERETIQERVTQRIDQLKEERETTGEINTKTGKWFGRQEVTKEDLPKNFEKYYNMMKNKTITKIEMADLLNVSRQTVYRWIKLYENN